MRIKVLGCSGAVFPGHNLSGFLLDGKVLFDAGSLTNILNEMAQWRISDIFITHAHLDHIREIPFLADNVIVKNKRHRINVFSLPLVLGVIKRNLLNNSIWPDFTVIPTPEEAILNLIELKNGKSIHLKDYTITPYRVNHSVPTVGYLIEDKNKKSFFYTGDTGPTPSVWKKLKVKLNCLIIEVSFPNRMKELAINTGHLTPELLKEELLKIKHMPERIYITHTKPQHLKTIRKELERLGLKNLRLLKDEETLRI